MPIRNGKQYIIVNPYENGGNLHLKGQMHCHSNYLNATRKDDGLYSASSVMIAYKDAGYNFATITGHSIITPNPEVDGITWLTDSVEYGYIYNSSGGGNVTSLKHIVVYGEDILYVPLYQSYDTQILINDSHAKNKLVSFAHPEWSGHYRTSKNYMESIYNLNFIEVYNEDNAEEQWDWNLSVGQRVFGLAVDDYHRDETTVFNAGWVVVHSNANDSDSILQSLRDGNFYASTGNDISIAVSGNVVSATSASPSNFSFIGRNGYILKTENNVVSSNYVILGDESYVRVKSVLASSSGLVAWSQPIFVEVIAPDGEEIGKINTLTYNNSMNENIIINGNMDIWQRGTSFSVSASTLQKTQYIADMFYYAKYGAMGYDVTRSTSVPNFIGTENQSSFYSLEAKCSAPSNSIGGNNYVMIGTRIEGYNYAPMIGKSVSLSWWVKSSLSGNYCMTIMNSLYNKSYIIPYSINESGMWEKKDVSLYIPLDRTGFFGSGLGLDIKWILTSGSLFHSDSSLQWIDGYYFATSNQVNSASSLNNTFSLAQVKLEIGSISTPFYPKNHNEELEKCKRYFRKSSSENITLEDGMLRHNQYTVTGIMSGVARNSFEITPEMRATPNVTFYRTSDGDTSGSAAICINGTWEDANVYSNSQTSSNNLSVGVSKSGIVAGSSYEISVGWSLDSSL
jgi:hypothetical protein